MLYLLGNTWTRPLGHKNKRELHGEPASSFLVCTAACKQRDRVFYLSSCRYQHLKMTSEVIEWEAFSVRDRAGHPFFSGSKKLSIPGVEEVAWSSMIPIKGNN